MKISIAMATFNGEKYIEDQLNSLLNQTVKPDEIIISDDGSQDNTVSVIKSFIEKWPQIIKLVTNKKGQGYSSNFNSALLQVTGDMIFLCDQDDVWFERKIEKMLCVAKGNSDYLIYMNDAQLTDGELNPTELTKIGQIKSMGLDLDSFVMGCCCMVKKELLTFTMPIPDDYPSHDDWFVKIADALDAKYIHAEALQYYRRHDCNESKFIPNRLKKVTKRDLWLTRLSDMLGNKIEKDKKAEDYYSQCESFLTSIYSIEAIIPEKYADKFDQFLRLETKKQKVLRLRYELRKKAFLKRITFSIWYFFSLYERKERLKNMLRDVFS